eukprot:2331134-Rhodomonas_salina.1
MECSWARWRALIPESFSIEGSALAASNAFTICNTPLSSTPTPVTRVVCRSSANQQVPGGYDRSRGLLRRVSLDVGQGRPPSARRQVSPQVLTPGHSHTSTHSHRDPPANPSTKSHQPPHHTLSRSSTSKRHRNHTSHSPRRRLSAWRSPAACFRRGRARWGQPCGPASAARTPCALSAPTATRLRKKAQKSGEIGKK